MSYINLNVLACEEWSSNQFIVRVSQADFISQEIDPRKRVTRKEPQWWIYIDSTQKIPIGVQSISVTRNGDWENYGYSPEASVKDDPDVKNLVQSFSSVSLHDITNEKFNVDQNLSEMLSINEEFSKKLIHQETPRCTASHSYCVSVELGMIWCKGCGDIKLVPSSK